MFRRYRNSVVLSGRAGSPVAQHTYPAELAEGPQRRVNLGRRQDEGSPSLPTTGEYLLLHDPSIWEWLGVKRLRVSTAPMGSFTCLLLLRLLPRPLMGPSEHNGLHGIMLLRHQICLIFCCMSKARNGYMNPTVRWPLVPARPGHSPSSNRSR
jgi:hypothetical protein